MKVFDNFEEGVQLVDEEMRYVYLNKSLLDSVGKTLEDHVGKRMQEVYPGIEEQPVYQKIKDCFKDSQSRNFQNSFLLEGKVTYWELRFERIAEGVLIFSRNITDVDEKQALEIPFEFISEPCFLVNNEDDENPIIERCNQAMCDIMQTTEDKLLGLSPFDISPEFQVHVGKRTDEYGSQVVQEVIENGFTNFEWTHRRFNGQEFLVEVFARTYFYKGSDYILVSWRDLTQLKEQEKINQHQAKMAMIGQLAAGVGHEINNPLAIILGHIEIVNLKLNRGLEIDHDFLKSVMEKLSISTQRIVQITDGLKSFARDDVNVLETFSPLEAIKESQYLLFELFKKEDIKLDVLAPKDVESFTIYGNRGKFQQVMANLVTNAKHAVRESEHKIITITLVRKPKTLEIYVKDTGHGIPESLHEKIFDPFFTTKEVHEGTGLGMAFVYRYLQEMEGSISIESSNDKGTVFKLVLPQASS